jgi:hypothetical protein
VIITLSSLWREGSRHSRRGECVAALWTCGALEEADGAFAMKITIILKQFASRRIHGAE